MRQRQRVEGEVPGGVPRVLPLVGHRDDVVVDHVEPVRVAGIRGIRRGSGLELVLLQPFVTVEEVILLAPQHAGHGLAHHVGRVGQRLTAE